MTALQIKYCDIPSYLHTGGFYRGLNSNHPEETIEIPADRFHQDGETAANLEEFCQLLGVMDFWMLDEIPVGILHFCNTHDVEEWEQSIAELPDAPRKELQPLLLSVYTESESLSFGDIIKTYHWDLIMHAVIRMGHPAFVTVAAAHCGHLRLLQYLHENGFVWREDTCAAASRKGHLDCLKYARENGCLWDSMTTKCAAQEGHLDCLIYAHENRCPWDVEVFQEAAQNGHLSCMQYAHGHGLREWHKDVCMKAAMNGHLDCLRFACENGCPWDFNTTLRAAQEGRLDCLRYALKQRSPVRLLVGACREACMGGHLECLRLLHEFGAVWDAYLAHYAAQCPRADCLQYLHENGCHWEGYTPDQAALAGHIEPLRYALEHGCPHYANIVERTAHGGNLNCLQYVVEDQGLYMDEKVFKMALLKGDLANLQYLLDQGCPFLDAEFLHVENQDNYQIVFREDNPEFALCVDFAVGRGWIPCSNFIQFVVTRDEPCRDWLIKKGFYAEGYQPLDRINWHLFLNH